MLVVVVVVIVVVVIVTFELLRCARIARVVVSQTYGVDFVDWDRFVIVSLVICTQSARVCCVCCSVDGDDMFALTSLVPWVSRSDVKRRASVLSLSLSLSLSCACDIVARAARQGTGVPLFHRGGP